MKIAVCVPHYGPLNARFVASLADLIAATATATVTYNGAVLRPQIKTFFSENGPLEYKRTILVKAALEWGADYVQWIDSDQTFPSDATFALAKHNLPIVGCNYCRRGSDKPTAIDLGGAPIVTSSEKARLALVEEAGAIGFGFCLVKSAVFSQVPHPWFRSEFTADGEVVSGEDVHFANQARTVGIPTHLDHGLSWRIGHVAEVIRLNSDVGDANARTALPAAGP
jgi:hypothetical protein